MTTKPTNISSHLFTMLAMLVVFCVALLYSYAQKSILDSYELQLASENQVRAFRAKLTPQAATQIGAAPSLRSPPPATSAPFNPFKPLKPPRNLVEHPSELFHEHPDLRMEFLKAFSSGLAFRYADLFYSLKLTSEQIQSFEEILIRYEQHRTDLFADGMTITDPDYKGRNQVYRDEKSSALLALLGDEGYQQYRRFENSADSRAFANAVVNDLYFTSDALSASLAHQLSAVLVDSGVTKDSPGMPSSSTLDNYNAALEKGRAFLSSRQFEALSVQIDSQAAYQQVRKMLPHVKNLPKR